MILSIKMIPFCIIVHVDKPFITLIILLVIFASMWNYKLQEYLWRYHFCVIYFVTSIALFSAAFRGRQILGCFIYTGSNSYIIEMYLFVWIRLIVPSIWLFMFTVFILIWISDFHLWNVHLSALSHCLLVFHLYKNGWTANIPSSLHFCPLHFDVRRYEQMPGSSPPRTAMCGPFRKSGKSLFSRKQVCSVTSW